MLIDENAHSAHPLSAGITCSFSMLHAILHLFPFFFFPQFPAKLLFFTLKVVCACRANHYSLHTKGRESFFFFSKTSLHRHPYTGLQLAALVNTTSTAHGDTCTRRAFVQKKKKGSLSSSVSQQTVLYYFFFCLFCTAGKLTPTRSCPISFVFFFWGGGGHFLCFLSFLP